MATCYFISFPFIKRMNQSKSYCCGMICIEYEVKCIVYKNNIVVIRWVYFDMTTPYLAYAWQIGPFWQDILDMWCCHGNETHLKWVNMNISHQNCMTKNWTLTHWGWGKMNAISQTTFSNAFSWMKILEYQLKLHWNFFLGVQLTISQH